MGILNSIIASLDEPDQQNKTIQCILNFGCKDFDVPDQQNLANLSSSYDHQSHLHVVLNDIDGGIYHKNLYNENSWFPVESQQPPFSNHETLSGQICCTINKADPNGHVHVFVIGNNGGIFHNSGGFPPPRTNNPIQFKEVWQLYWDKVPLSGGFKKSHRLSATFDLDGNLHLLATDSLGVLWHNSRDTSGHWQLWNKVPNATNTGTFIVLFRSISAAISKTGAIHLCAVDGMGLLYHRLFLADVPTYPTWSNVTNEIRDTNVSPGNDFPTVIEVVISSDDTDTVHIVAAPFRLTESCLSPIYFERSLSQSGVPHYTPLVYVLQEKNFDPAISIGFANA